MTLYDIKPKFQDLLRPLVCKLAASGITANHVTITALLGSFLVAILLILNVNNSTVFLILPIWMFLRMALNAIDGMLAREFNQKSHFGAYLNELTDVIADAVLFFPFSLVFPFSSNEIMMIILLSILSEFSGVMGLTIGASRRYDGPMGKSDRALFFGALALWIGLAGSLPEWIYWFIPVASILICLNIFNRIKMALNELVEHKNN